MSLLDLIGLGSSNDSATGPQPVGISHEDAARLTPEQAYQVAASNPSQHFFPFRVKPEQLLHLAASVGHSPAELFAADPILARRFGIPLAPTPTSSPESEPSYQPASAPDLPSLTKTLQQQRLSTSQSRQSYVDTSRKLLEDLNPGASYTDYTKNPPPPPQPMTPPPDTAPAPDALAQARARVYGGGSGAGGASPTTLTTTPPPSPRLLQKSLSFGPGGATVTLNPPSGVDVSPGKNPATGKDYAPGDTLPGGGVVRTIKPAPGAGKSDFSAQAAEGAISTLTQAKSAIGRLRAAGILTDNPLVGSVGGNYGNLVAAARVSQDRQTRDDANFLLNNLQSAVPILARGFGESRPNQPEEARLAKALNPRWSPAATLESVIDNYINLYKARRPAAPK